MASATQKPSPFPGPRVLKRFFSPLWWQHAFIFSWQFRSHLILPAIFFLLFALIVVALKEVGYGLQGASNQPVDAGPFLAKLVGVVAGLAMSGIFFLCGMFLGVLKLSAFTRAFLLCPLPQNYAAMKDSAYQLQTHMCQTEAVEAMSKHKAYLGKAWLVATLVMLPGVFVAAVAACIAITLSAETGVPVPDEYRHLAIYPIIFASAVGILLNNYSVVTLAVTSLTNRTVGQATRQSLLLTLTTAPLMTVVSAFVLVLTTLVTTPYSIMGLLQPASQTATPDPLALAMAWQVWQVVTGILVYPLGTALVAEVVRDAIVEDAVKVDTTAITAGLAENLDTLQTVETVETLQTVDQNSAIAPALGNSQQKKSAAENDTSATAQLPDPPSSFATTNENTRDNTNEKANDNAN
jgi:hypothetical protein